MKRKARQDIDRPDPLKMKNEKLKKKNKTFPYKGILQLLKLGVVKIMKRMW
jgi:hypothetical protein